jgi:chromosome segregation ATPase
MTFFRRRDTDPEISRQLDRISEALIHLIRKTDRMALNFTRLENEVAELSTVVDSAVSLLQQVAQEIRDNVANQGKLEKLADSLDQKATVLGQAIAANTPGEEPEPVDPVEPAEPPVDPAA